MNKTLISLGLGAAMLGATLTLATSGTGAVASNAESIAAKDAARAARYAAKASAAIVRHKRAGAVNAAEAAVSLSPGNAEYRALLGQAYLSDGRFASAAQALADSLTLDPSNGRAALNLALAQTALGDWAAARDTLDAHAERITPADRGLALALAGDPAGGVAILGTAARDPSANATLRQNFALALALSGRWAEARAIASVDLSPADVDRRIEQWATFARPQAAPDQVAALLGVKPAVDGGQPVALALRPVAPGTAVASADPAPKVVPAEAVAAAAVPAPAAAPEAVAPVLAAVGPAPAITFAPRREVVQALPAAYRTWQQHAPVRTALRTDAPVPAAAPVGKGAYFVQLGAFENSGVAREAWQRFRARVPALAGMTPTGSRKLVAGEQFYRLAVGGFARGDALRLCGSVRASGGRCFVREAAGDQVASWARGTQVASR